MGPSHAVVKRLQRLLQVSPRVLYVGVRGVVSALDVAELLQASVNSVGDLPIDLILKCTSWQNSAVCVVENFHPPNMNGPFTQTITVCCIYLDLPPIPM